MRDIRSEVAKRAEDLTLPNGGFDAQGQELPGETEAMSPTPDHGETSYRGSGKLSGLKALITGGDSGIGRATAIAFAREGADVAISYLEEEQADAEETKHWINEAGQQAVLLPGDLTEEGTCHKVVDRAVEELGVLDILINNAGHQMARGDTLRNLPSERIDETFKTNLYAMFWLTRRAIPHLPRGGSIINTSSIQAYQPSPKLIDYAATKSAILNFTANLAQELGPDGIRVNAVAPGPIWTPLQPATQAPDRLPTFGTNTPLGRAGQPSEVAPAFVYLASPDNASYVSGTVLGVTGGKGVF